MQCMSIGRQMEGVILVPKPVAYSSGFLFHSNEIINPILNFMDYFIVDCGHGQ